ncbi:MAG: hypothetical protein Q4C03_07015, partial [bacterium]|nr:hypothetical protein [bacterium]
MSGFFGIYSENKLVVVGELYIIGNLYNHRVIEVVETCPFETGNSVKHGVFCAVVVTFFGIKENIGLGLFFVFESGVAGLKVADYKIIEVELCIFADRSITVARLTRKRVEGVKSCWLS